MSDLAPREVARELGLSRSAVYRLIEDGELEAYRMRGRLRVEPREIRALKERNRVAHRRNEQPIYEAFSGRRESRGDTFVSDIRSRKGAA